MAIDHTQTEANPALHDITLRVSQPSTLQILIGGGSFRVSGEQLTLPDDVEVDLDGNNGCTYIAYLVKPAEGHPLVLVDEVQDGELMAVAADHPEYTFLWCLFTAVVPAGVTEASQVLITVQHTEPPTVEEFS